MCRERWLGIGITYAGNFPLNTYGTGGVYLNWFSETGITFGKGNGGLVAAFLNNENDGTGNGNPQLTLDKNGTMATKTIYRMSNSGTITLG